MSDMVILMYYITTAKNVKSV